MKWLEYKRIVNQPDTMSRWMLEQSAELLACELADCLLTFLKQDPITKPPDHMGGKSTDMFRLKLKSEQARQVLKSIERAVKEGRVSSATAERGLGGFQEAWQEVFDFFEQQNRG